MKIVCIFVFNFLTFKTPKSFFNTTIFHTTLICLLRLLVTKISKITTKFKTVIKSTNIKQTKKIVCRREIRTFKINKFKNNRINGGRKKLKQSKQAFLILIIFFVYKTRAYLIINYCYLFISEQQIFVKT